MEGIFKLKCFEVLYNDRVFKITTDSILLGAYADCRDACSILDIGCGTGIISLMLAQKNPQARIYGIDISYDAFKLCSKNFSLSPWADRLIALHGDISDYNFAGMKFDCIVSNPPFFHNSLLSDTETDRTARHNIKLDYTALAKSIANLLSDRGRAYIIIPYDNFDLLNQAFNFEYLFCREKLLIFSREGKKPKRVILKFGRGVSECLEKSFFIKQGKEFSQQYINLTKDFYINF